MEPNKLPYEQDIENLEPGSAGTNLGSHAAKRPSIDGGLAEEAGLLRLRETRASEVPTTPPLEGDAPAPDSTLPPAA